MGFVFALLVEEGQVCREPGPTFPPRPGSSPEPGLAGRGGDGARTVSAVGPAEFVVQLLLYSRNLPAEMSQAYASSSAVVALTSLPARNSNPPNIT